MKPAAEAWAVRGRWLAAFTLALCLGAPARPGFGQAGSTVSFHSSRFGYLERPDGTADLLLLDASGEARQVVSLEKQIPVLGPGEVYALLSRDISGPDREVQVFEASGGRLAQFRIPADRDLAVRTAMLALVPIAGDAPGAPFDFEFLSFNGDRLASHVRKELTLATMFDEPNGHPIAYSLDKNGDYRLHHFGTRGELIWEVASEGSVMPVVALSTAGTRAVVGTIHPDRGSSSLRLLDSSGRAIKSVDVPTFRLALFSPDERYLLLEGARRLELRGGQDAVGIWSEDAGDELRMVSGQAIAFSKTGSRFYALWQERDADDNPGKIRVRSYAILGRDVQRTEKVIDEMPAGRELAILELGELADGRLRIVTEGGIWSIGP